MAKRQLGWKVVEHVNHKKFSNGGVIVVEDDPDIIHVDNSSDLALTTSLNDLEITALHIDGQSIDVDAPPDIIVVDEDDDIIDDEDVLLHDLVDSDDKDFVNVDDGDGMSADVARGHGGNGGSVDRPPLHQLANGCRGSGKNFWIIARELENPIWEAGNPAGCIPARKPGTSDHEGVPDALWFLEQHPDGAEGEGPRKDWGGSWTLAALRDKQEEMLRLQGLGTYTDDQIMAMVRGGKQRGHIPSVGRVLVGRGKDVIDVPSQHESRSGSGCCAAVDDESCNDEDADEDEEDTDS
ncbi:hypothetical protein Tco_0657218 [Tanacetum coccineum]|uniref:Uncharacterized protein n=1 Tax=Tanacetum coccineum TaxID=301880 RepID=A0ABQ4XAY7_9ASTR